MRRWRGATTSRPKARPTRCWRSVRRRPALMMPSSLRAQAISGRKDWAQAAIAYDDSYNRAPTGSHAPDALLGLANSLVNLNEKKAACETLSKLKAEFPSARPDIREPAGAIRLRAGCG